MFARRLKPGNRAFGSAHPFGNSILSKACTGLGLGHLASNLALAEDRQKAAPTHQRINATIKDITRDPFAGIGKPEPLKHALAGFWSRRTNDEHRIVHRISDGKLLIAHLRYHY